MKFDSATDIPSLEGKVIIITGSNAGLGKQAVIELAKHHPARIWLAARSAQKAQDAIKDIHGLVPNAKISFLQLDLASFSSIRKAAASFIAESDRLDMLILNAGGNFPRQEFTEEGYEMSFGVNHMGHALLAELLMPKMLKTAEQPGSSSSDVRIVSVSSGAHAMTVSGGIKFDVLKIDDRNFNSQWSYGRSKLANILWAKELAARCPRLKTASVDPGMVQTEGVITTTEGKPFWRFVAKYVWPLVAQPVEEGVKSPLWAAVSKDVVSGEYYSPVGVSGKGSKWSKDAALQKALWEYTEKELGRVLDI